MNKQLFKQLEDILNNLSNILKDVKAYRSRITSNKYQELDSVFMELRTEYIKMHTLLYGGK